MKFLAVFLLITVSVASALPPVDSNIAAKWEKHKSNHGRRFKSAEEEEKRLANFVAVDAAIDAHNKNPHNTFTLAHNERSDWTLEELSQTRGKISRQDIAMRTFGNPIMEDRVNPASYDFRTTPCGKNMTMKNQGQCGCCWAFSAIAGVEAPLCLKTNKYVPLSEQQLIECDTNDYGCNGGDPTYAYGYLTSAAVGGKVATGASYPFSSSTGTKGTCKSVTSVGATISKYTTIPWTNASAMVDPIQTAISKYGVVSACVLVSNNTATINGQIVPTFDYYQSGVYSDAVCNKTIQGSGFYNTNHCVALVGWGKDTTSGLDYWIMRNQWGSTWGLGGYMNIQRGVNMCGIEGEVTYVDVL